MEIRVLGAHNCERQSQKMVSLLIDDVLAIDAGSITSSLSLEGQKKIKALLLTHQHYDHVRDIPGLAMSLFLGGGAIRVYSIQAALDVLAKHFLNGEIHTDFRRKPETNPTLSLTALEPNKAVEIEGYSVLPVPVKHGVPTVGYQVTSGDGRSVFYTGDTGPGLEECWRRVKPQLLIIEVTSSDRFAGWAGESGHLAPSLLKQELASFQKLNGYLPRVVAVHMSPNLEAEIAAELAAVAEELECSITVAKEGMEISI
jgi:phosphoribosyl 1,2-cyclic phosphodiesterase